MKERKTAHGFSDPTSRQKPSAAGQTKAGISGSHSTK